MSSERRSEPQAPGHEVEGLHVRTIVLLGIGLLVLVLVVQAGLALAMYSLIPQRSLVDVNQQWQQPRLGPGVQPNQAYDRQRYEKQFEQRLHSYSWQDDQHQAAQIPIERAIELMSEAELQVEWPESSPDEPADSDAPPEKPAKEDAR